MDGRFLRRGVVAVALGFLVAACSDDQGSPVSVTEDGHRLTTASRGDDPREARHVFLFHAPKVSPGFSTAVETAGGTVLSTYGAIGVAVATGLTDGDAATIAGTSAVAARDVLLQWVPTPQEAGAETIELTEEPGAQAHDPTTAAFFPFQWNMQIIRAHDAWNAGFEGDPGVKVAILDTGLDPFHADLAGLIDVANSIAFTPSLNAAGPDWGDDHWHGTHVGGTVVTNGIGTSGVAPHVTLIAVKVLDVTGSGSFADVIGGILHAGNVGADVINMSLGATFSKKGGGPLVAALNRAVNHANRNGTLVVSAAGNENVDLQHNKNLIATPCESGAGICISATGPTDMKASYSNFGVSAIDLAAPGGDFVVTGNVFTSTVLAPCSTLSLQIPVCQAGGVYLFAQGTSQATPHVSGLAALLDSQFGGARNAAQLMTAIKSGAADLGKKGTDPIYGRGRIDVCTTVGC